jgi:hypothetical protein
MKCSSPDCNCGIDLVAYRRGWFGNRRYCLRDCRDGRTARCAVCDGKFGLVRYYSWQTPLCSKKCVDRFRTRRTSDRNWLPWFQIGLNQASENRVRPL